MNGKDFELADEIIARQIDIFRFAAGERQKVINLLKQLEDDLIDKLRQADLTATRRADLTRLLTQAQTAINDYYRRAADQVGQSLTGLARVEAASTATSLTTVFQGALAVQLPSETYFSTLVSDTLIQGAPSAQWWQRQAGDAAFRFANEVRQGLAQAETTDQIIRRIRAPGVMAVTRKNAATLVNTSVQTVANGARMATMRANADIVKGVKQLSTLDGHTSTICLAYSGGEWDMEGKPINGTKLPFNGGPPRHFNCRSVLVPITKTFKELGVDLPEPAATTRAASGGPLSAGTTMKEFIERKGKAFTDELLGPGRAELYREGKITLQQLVDQTGRPLTLEQLRAKYGS